MVDRERPARVRSVTRARILATAEELFFTRGYGATSVEAIAHEAGYTTGAIYSNFGGKASLFLEILEQTAERNLEAARARLAEAQTDEEKMAILVASLIPGDARWRSTLAASLEFLADLRRQGRVHERRVRAAEQHVQTALTEIVGAACAALGLDHGDRLEDLARDVLALTRGYGLKALMDEEFDLEAAITTGVTVVLTGVRTDVRSIATTAPTSRRGSESAAG